MKTTSKKLIEIFPKDYLFLTYLYPITMCFVLFGMTWLDIIYIVAIDTLAFFVVAKPANLAFFAIFKDLRSLENFEHSAQEAGHSIEKQKEFFCTLASFPSKRSLFVFLASFIKVAPAGIYIAFKSEAFPSFWANLGLFYLGEIFVLGYVCSLLFLELHKMNFELMKQIMSFDGWKQNYRHLKLTGSQELFSKVMNFIIIALIFNLFLIFTYSSYMPHVPSTGSMLLFFATSLACIVLIQILYSRYFGQSLKALMENLHNLEVLPLHTTPLLAGFDYAFNQLGLKVQMREQEIVQWMNHETGQSHFRTLGEMTALVAHDLKNPLNVMRMCVDIINKPGTSEEEKKKLLRMLDRNLDQSLSLTQTIMSYSRGSKEKEFCPFGDIHQNLMELFSIQFFNDDFGKIDFKIEENMKTLTLPVNRLDLMHIFYNIYDNAIKSTLKAGHAHPTISLWCEEDNDKVHLHLQDSGEGLKEDEFKELVTFDRINGNGSFYKGLGIKLTNSLIKNVGGELSMIPVDKGTCMRVTFNKA